MCPGRIVTNTNEPVKVECPILFWLGLIGSLIMAGFLAVVSWDSWLTIRQAEVIANAKVASVVDENTIRRLEEVRDDVKELLRRTPK